MAPIKFEDKLKDKLETRTLEPSPDAWNSLADRLDNHDKKNNNTKFWWLGIAASIIGVILVTTQFYKNESVVKDLPIVVDTKTEPQNKTEFINEDAAIEKIISNPESETENLEGIEKTELASTQNSKTDEIQKTIKKEDKISQPEIINDDVASLDKSKPELNDNPVEVILSPEELKVIEVVDLIKQLKTEESSVSDKEIDSLLKQAQREILKQRIFDESSRTVNADALLQDVEVELERSFRDKVFEALKSGYGSVKTAVAERRN